MWQDFQLLNSVDEQYVIKSNVTQVFIHYLLHCAL